MQDTPRRVRNRSIVYQRIAEFLIGDIRIVVAVHGRHQIRRDSGRIGALVGGGTGRGSDCLGAVTYNRLSLN